MGAVLENINLVVADYSSHVFETKTTISIKKNTAGDASDLFHYEAFRSSKPTLARNL